MRSQPPESFDDSREHFHEALDVGGGARPADRDRAASDRRRRPSRPAPATVRASPTSTTIPSARRRRAGRARAGSARPRRRRRRGTRGWAARASAIVGAEALDAGNDVDHLGRAPRSARAAPRLRRRGRPPRTRRRTRPTRARLSMPARRARSCAPPTSERIENRSPRRTSSAPAPFGPPSLCAVTEQRSASSARKSTGDVPGRRARVDVHEHAPLARRRGTRRAAGCSVPTS